MSNISVIGLGAMGSALAHTLLGVAYSVTVWNRTTSKMQPLVTLGANGARNIVEAVRASPVILICVDNYSVTRSLLDTDAVTPHLRTAL
jgi:3-hydroxyisobutyrate dehydrogenase-like beta-hydroxyacid dehydrogenase